MKSRGCLTLDDLKTVGNWKSPRIRPKIARNTDALVQEVTRSMLQTKSIRLAVYIPQALVGVGMPVASTLLHWFHDDPYPILDFRALWSMGFDDGTVYSLDFWESYVNSVRQLAQDWNVDMRTLDRALWQYSNEHQPAQANAVKVRPGNP
ncbi:MAG: hypothetical protein KF784_12450 [Fimbriimonadaceae bacterium]|nr:hypothetical protein [Fimbriimonadaceae bacterium]